ncbi:hypothetical protein BDZ91DRAFT_237983 [Kalaharituber pfeilii]|nr:hypothetical protein BDZ91DRAFT_237983 [Kalaharituber pfeilii]
MCLRKVSSLFYIGILFVDLFPTTYVSWWFFFFFLCLNLFVLAMICFGVFWFLCLCV